MACRRPRITPRSCGSSSPTRPNGKQIIEFDFITGKETVGREFPDAGRAHGPPNREVAFVLTGLVVSRNAGYQSVGQTGVGLRLPRGRYAPSLDLSVVRRRDGGGGAETSA